MKTVEEFYKEIAGSMDLWNELKAIKSRDELGAFLKNHCCGASVEEYEKYAYSQQEGEIEDADAEAVAGGMWFPPPPPPLPPIKVQEIP